MRYAITLALLISIIAILGGLKAAQISKLIGYGQQMEKMGAPPESVNTARVEEQDWEQTLSGIATVVSSQGLALSNDAPGIVTKLYFESGAKVREGQRLVELDTDVERAQLESLRARLKLARRSLGRTRQLAATGTSTPAELDAEESQWRSLNADVKALQAQIARKAVRAPFAGKLGIREVNLGQYLAPGTPVTVIESPEGVFVDFTLPQQDLETLELGQRVRVRGDPAQPPIAEGRISAFDASIDVVTRAIKVRAAVPNPDDRLHPGMFVNAEVVLPEIVRVVAVPGTAVVRATYGDSVFVVEVKDREPDAANVGAGGPPARVARQQFVRLGRTRGDFVSVLEGLSVGQEVVTAGAFKLRNGAPISVKNDVTIQPEKFPRPENR
jgi:membrane fusion protein (multidrug efflux system)